MSRPTTQTIVNSHSASALHARLKLGTLKARQLASVEKQPARRRPRRVSDSAIWRLLDGIRPSGSTAESQAAQDRALRQVLAGVLDGANREDRSVALVPRAGSVLIVRSGPWPVLRTLVETIASFPQQPTVTVLCHQRDAQMLHELGQLANVTLRPLFYPRFEPFNPTTLKRVLAADAGTWERTILLDAARTGTSRSLDHITGALASIPGEKYVWNASGHAFQPLTLLETLGRQRYEIVRRLLRWHASQQHVAN